MMRSGIYFALELESLILEKIPRGLLRNDNLCLRTHAAECVRPIYEQYSATSFQDPFYLFYECLAIFDLEQDIGYDDRIDGALGELGAADFLYIRPDCMNIGKMPLFCFIGDAHEQILLHFKRIDLAVADDLRRGESIRTAARAQVRDRHAVLESELFEI